MNQWVGLALSYIFVFVVIGIAQGLLRGGLVGPAITRKIVHIGVAHWWIIAMLVFEDPAIALIGPVSFIAINSWSWKRHVFAAMEHEDHRRNLGTIWFPVALTGLVLLTWGIPGLAGTEGSSGGAVAGGWLPRWYGLVAILVLGWGDGLASIVGERWGSRPGARRFRVPGGTKSAVGTTAMLLAAGTVTALVVWLFTGPLTPLAGAPGDSLANIRGPLPALTEALQGLTSRTWVAQPTDHLALVALARLDGFVRILAEHSGTPLLDPAGWQLAPSVILALALVVAAGATAAELLTPWGIDNLTVPATVIVLLAVLLAFPGAWVVRIAWALTLNLLVAVGAYSRRSVTAGGAVAGASLGTVIFVSGGGFFWSVLMAFFFSSSILGRIKHAARSEAERITAKGGRRDAIQVCANGGLAAGMAVLHAFTGSPLFILGFAIALAAANGDTWASEIGVLSRRDPVSILTLRRVPRGTSGGVSPLGLIASAAGALFVALWFALGYWGTSGWNALEVGAVVLVVTAGGFLGALVDSLLGATVQAQYWDRLRGATTERPRDARGLPNPLTRGWAPLNNDAVNALSGLISTIAVVLLVTS